MRRRFTKLVEALFRRAPRPKRRSRGNGKDGRRGLALILASAIGLGAVLGAALMAMQEGHAPQTWPSLAAPQVAAAPPMPQMLPPLPVPNSTAVSTATANGLGSVASIAATPGPPPTTATARNPDRERWRQYALAMPATDGRPMIAIVIDDMGLDKKEAAEVIGLPGPLTIAFMAYASDLPSQAAAARAAGHEIWLHVPMEPLDRDLDAGPNTLKTELPPEENLRRLNWDLGRLDGYVGINNHMGSRFSSWQPGMRLVLEEVKARGLAFLDSRTSASTVAGRLAGELGVPHVDRDVFIDNDETVGSVLVQLGRAEQLAEKRGYALAIGHPHATTIAALLQWLPTLKQKGLVLVPASALLRHPETASAG